MDFIPLSREASQLSTVSSSEKNERRRGSRPPKPQQPPPPESAPPATVPFHPNHWPQQQMQQQQHPPPPASSHVSSSTYSTNNSATPPPNSNKHGMSTFPSNSSMQSNFVSQQQQQQQRHSIASASPAGGAAARRRMRSQIRTGGSFSDTSGGASSSINGDDYSSTFSAAANSTPPASPATSSSTTTPHSRPPPGPGGIHTVGSTGSASQRHSSRPDFVASYATIPMQRRPSFGNVSVCSSTAGSECGSTSNFLFDSNNPDGGFTFDAFGLDAQEIDREVQEAMQALAGSGHGDYFNGFLHQNSNSSFGGASRASTPPLSQHQRGGGGKDIHNTTVDTSIDDFAPQGWDSPPGSRHSVPSSRQEQTSTSSHKMDLSSAGHDDEEEEDGFVDGFRVSKPSPLPLVQVGGGSRYQSSSTMSPASSERSSSVSSITDHNTDGVPRRNVFKEQAGFSRSSSSTHKKSWQPPPGAVKMLTPPRPQAPPSASQIQAQVETVSKRDMQSAVEVEDESESYWMKKMNSDQMMEEQKQQPKAPPKSDGGAASRRRWQSAAARYVSPQSTPQHPLQPHSQKVVQQQQPPQWLLQEGQSQHHRLVQQHDQQSFEADFEANFQDMSTKGTTNRARPKEGQPTETRDEEKKDDASDSSNKEKDNHTDTTEATTAFTASSNVDSSPIPVRRSYAEPSKSRQQQRASSQAQIAPLKKENLKQLQENLDQLEDELRADQAAEDHADILKQKSLSPQEQRKRELEELRGGGSSVGDRQKPSSIASKAQSLVHRPESPKIQPQQQRIAECNDQRASFASLRERLKSPTNDESRTTPQSSNSRFRHSISPSTPSATSALTSPKSGAKSEVGVSSFTRQKMKIATLSSNSSFGSKSEAGSRSPKINEANAILNRMRGMDSTGIDTISPSSISSHQKDSFRKSHSDVGQERPPPAFMGVKLKKTTPPPALQDKSPKYEDSNSQTQPLVQEQPPHSNDNSVPAKKMTYRERRELEVKMEEEERQRQALERQADEAPKYQYKPQKRSSVYNRAEPHNHREQYDQAELNRRFQERDLQEEEGHFSGPARHGMYDDEGTSTNYLRDESPSNEIRVQDNREKSQPTKKLTYRERRELELQQEQEEKRRKEEAMKAQEPPKKDVASLVRQRVAANRKSLATKAPPTDAEKRSQGLPFGKGMLKPTLQKSSTPEDSTSHEPYQRTYERPYDELSRENSSIRGSYDEPRASPHYSNRQYGRDDEGSQYYGSTQSEGQNASPRHYRDAYDNGQNSASHHSATQMSAEKISNDNNVTSGMHGMAALHAQLKKRAPVQDPASSVEERISPRHKDVGGSGPHQAQENPSSSAAPRRIQALVDGKSGELQIDTADSHNSGEHSNISPTRQTPKATYAMLNAFLHGREAISAPADDPSPSPTSEDSQEEGLEERKGSPPKKGKSSPSAANDERPALKDDPKYSRYFRMLKIGMPMDVVKHAMIRDCLDPAVMDGDHNKPACEGIPLKDDPKYSKYFKSKSCYPFLSRLEDIVDTSFKLKYSQLFLSAILQC